MRRRKSSKEGGMIISGLWLTPDEVWQFLEQKIATAEEPRLLRVLCAEEPNVLLRVEGRHYNLPTGKETGWEVFPKMGKEHFVTYVPE